MKRPVRNTVLALVAVVAVIASESNPGEVPLILGLGVPLAWAIDRLALWRIGRLHDWMVREATRTIAGARNPERVTRQLAAAIHWRLDGGKGPLPQWIKEMP